ncbi:unnamed protein product [Calypogeia fissa]
MDPDPTSNEAQKSVQTPDKQDQVEDTNMSADGEVEKEDTEIMTPLEDGKNPREHEQTQYKELISPKKLSKAPLETPGSESETESLSSKGQTKITKKKKSKAEREVSEEVMKRKETIKALLVSSEILPDEEEAPEEEVEEEPLPKPGHSHFKFLKKRCGKLVNLNTWVAPWQGYNMLETAKSWKQVDEWAPARQFIRYQNKLVVWRHDHPLAQHIGSDRGCLVKCCRRPITSSSWDN